MTKDRRYKHGMSHSGIQLYEVWKAMRRRCLNPRNSSYPIYGGRGITVCDRWNDFTAFLADMGPRPEGMTLDRVDNNGPYAPWNCRWATRKQQTHNSTAIKLVEFMGQTKAVCEWESSLGLSHGAVWQRLRLGWSLERALTTRKGGLQ